MGELDPERIGKMKNIMIVGFFLTAILLCGCDGITFDLTDNHF